MHIHIASDHAGFELKKTLVKFLREQGHNVQDMGADEFGAGDDYPDFILPMALKVAEDTGSFGIAIGGSGQGEAIVANRVPGICAAVWYGGERGDEIIRLSREHNDANVLSIGARFVSEEEAKHAVDLWLSTPFSGAERHVRRIKKISESTEKIKPPNLAIGGEPVPAV